MCSSWKHDCNACYLGYLVLHFLQICFHDWLVIFSQLSVTFLFAWHNEFSVSASSLRLNISCQELSLSHFRLCFSIFQFSWLTFNTCSWLLPRRPFLFPRFDSLLLQFNTNTSSLSPPPPPQVALLTRQSEDLMACKPTGQIWKSHWAF